MRHIASFLIATSFAVPAAADCTKDAYEPDSVAPAGAVLVGGTSQQRNFCDDAEDWISIPACPGRSYSLDTSALGAAADTLIELYDPEGTTLLAVDDDVAADPTGHLAWTATCSVGCTMHARVRQRDGTNGDLRDYKIQLTGDTSPCRTAVTQAESVPGEFLMYSGIAQSIDGGFVAVGYPDSGGLAPAVVTRWNHDGTIRWVHKLESGVANNGAQFPRIVRTSDGGFVFNDTDTAVLPRLVKITDDGAVSWARLYGAGYNDYIHGIASSRDGSIYAAGRLYEPTTQGDFDGWLLKLNSLGLPEWSLRLVRGSLHEVLQDVQARKDGGAVAAGVVDRGGGPWDGFVVEVSAAGVVERQTVFRGNAVGTEFTAVRPLADGGYLVGGSYCISSLSTCRALLLKVLPSGSIQWARTPNWLGTHDTVRSIDVFQDGSIYAHVSRNAPETEPILTRWDANGTLLWQTSAGVVFGGEHGIVSDDGGIALAAGRGETLGLVRVNAGGVAPSCSLLSPSDGVTGSAAITRVASSYGVASLTEPAPTVALAFTSLARGEAPACPCSSWMSAMISVAGKVDTAISWANDGGGPYDLVRGDIATLRSSGGNLTAALNAITPNQQCVAQATPDTLVVDSHVQPPPDTGYFYLVRGRGGDCPTLYDGSSPGQRGHRDAEITAASGPCQ